jgi:hypothetical protein
VTKAWPKEKNQYLKSKVIFEGFQLPEVREKKKKIVKTLWICIFDFQNV